MSQTLFSVAKVGLFLDAYVPGVEKRRGGDVKILTLTLRVQPFDAKLATSIDDGLENESGVRTGLFKLNHPDPKPHITRMNFNLGCPRQNLIIFASPDTEKASLVLAQAKITGTYARTQKDLDGYAFIFKASVGPVGREEQEFIHEWLLTQRFITFEESEPSLDFDYEAEVVDDDEAAGELQARPAPMWDDAETESTLTPAERATDKVRHIGRRGSAKKGKGDPDSERAEQAKAGKAKAHA